MLRRILNHGENRTSVVTRWPLPRVLQRFNSLSYSRKSQECFFSTIDRYLIGSNKIPIDRYQDPAEPPLHATLILDSIHTSKTRRTATTTTVVPRSVFLVVRLQRRVHFILTPTRLIITHWQDDHSNQHGKPGAQANIGNKRLP